MDRDELQERIRARRSGGDPYRRGGAADDEAGGGYARYEPEPEDSRVARGRRPGDRRDDHFDERAGAARGRGPDERADLTRERDEWAAPIGASAAVPPPAVEREPVAGEPAEPYPSEAVTRYDGEYDDPDYQEPGDYPYEYDDWQDREPRRSGAGAFAILGFLALGVLALLGGAVLAGVFNDDRSGVGQQSPLPSAAASLDAAPSVAASAAAPSVNPSAAASAAPPASGEPVTFPDGFTAEAQPCLPGSASASGCGSNGATNGGVLDIWVGFKSGTSDDLVGAEIIGPDGSTVGEGTISLADIGCSQSCNGWTYFNFSNLGPGTYEVRVTRNGEPASATSFEVS
jgi:hypothetical protein